MGVGAGLYIYDVVVKKFTFAISCPDESLLYIGTTRRIRLNPHVLRLCSLMSNYFDHLFKRMVEVI